MRPIFLPIRRTIHFVFLYEQSMTPVCPYVAETFCLADSWWLPSLQLLADATRQDSANLTSLLTAIS